MRVWKAAIMVVVLCLLPLSAWGEVGKKKSPGGQGGKSLAYSGIPGKFTRGAKAKTGKQAATAKAKKIRKA